MADYAQRLANFKRVDGTYSNRSKKKLSKKLKRMKSTTYKGLGTGRKDEEDEDREGVGEDGWRPDPTRDSWLKSREVLEKNH